MRGRLGFHRDKEHLQPAAAASGFPSETVQPCVGGAQGATRDGSRRGSGATGIRKTRLEEGLPVVPVSGQPHPHLSRSTEARKRARRTRGRARGKEGARGCLDREAAFAFGPPGRYAEQEREVTWQTAWRPSRETNKRPPSSPLCPGDRLVIRMGGNPSGTCLLAGPHASGLVFWLESRAGMTVSAHQSPQTPPPWGRAGCSSGPRLSLVSGLRWCDPELGGLGASSGGTLLAVGCSVHPFLRWPEFPPLGPMTPPASQVLLRNSEKVLATFPNPAAVVTKAGGPPFKT